MNRNRLIEKAITFLLIFLSSGITASLLYESLYFPHKVEVLGQMEIKAYVDGVFWPSGTLINWDQVNASSIHSKLLRIENTGDLNTTVYLNVMGLPENMSLTWIANGTYLMPGEYAESDLVLTIGDIKPGNYTFDSWVNPV